MEVYITIDNKKLTSRQKEIIILLTKSCNPITISYIAEKLNLSSRTVMRDMSKVEEWLDENDFEFIKKPGIGLLIDEDIGNKEFILELLEEEKIKIEYKKEERVAFVLSELLYSKEPIKLSYFTRKLKVSEGTLNNDLSFIYEWLSQFNLDLVKKPGYGIYIHGLEKDLREASINLIYNLHNQDDIIKLIKAINNDCNEMLENKSLNLIENDILQRVEKILKSIKNLGLADNSYIGLIVHISLVIQRIKNGDKISVENSIKEELSKTKEFDFAVKIVENIETEFEIVVNEDEIYYITMHLRGAKLRLHSSSKFDLIEENKILNLTKKIITMCSDEFSIDLNNDENLLKDLLNHLTPAIYRLTMKMDIRNPLLNEIKSEFKLFYTSIIKICDEIKNEFSLQEMPESEVAYITMHIVSAIEKNMMINSKIKVVIACPTGIGTAALLATKVKSYFKNIDILETISILDINDEYLKKNNIDLIISTVDIDTDFPYICISPFLKSTDKSIIDTNVRKIVREKAINKEETEVNYTHCQDDVFKVMTLGKSIINFLNEMKVVEDVESNNLEELIDYCSKLFVKDEAKSKYIKEALSERLDRADLYFEELDIMLPHCQTKGIDSMKLAFIKLQKELNLKNDDKTSNIMLMLMPDNADSYDKELLSFISVCLIENSNFLESIKSYDIEKIYDNIKLITSKFYKNKLKELEKNE